ncbi:MAG: histidinol dehydrogenase [Solirubrobacterales bacterium]
MRVHTVEWDGADPAGLARSLRSRVAEPEGIREAVGAIVSRVASEGDSAVIELGERFDGSRPASLRVAKEEVEAASSTLDSAFVEALRIAARNVRTVAEAQLAAGPVEVGLPEGHVVTIREVPVGSAGVYAPGGGAALASTVLMCAIPAHVAGVERIVVASPPGPEGHVSAAVLAACAEAGVREVYAIGGAQAIAALALGTEKVAPVDVVVGPGNPYTQEAKRQLFGRVGVDGIAGPSELMVIADRGARLDWVALDLCAQAEHGADSPLILASEDTGVLEEVAASVERAAAERPSVTDAPLTLVRVPGHEAALALAEAFAPEHLQLAGERAEALAGLVTTAGCVFVGPHSGTAFGDYASGSNHVLPTGGAGRFQGPLGPAAFRRRIANVSLPGPAAAALAPSVDALARAEGLPVHGESAKARE